MKHVRAFTAIQRLSLLMVLSLLSLALFGCGGGGSTEPTSTEIVFTIGSTVEEHVFAPVLTVTGSPEITWTFDDGTTSNSATPTKDFGSAGTHTARLVVNPWSAVTRINIGYDGGDGGVGSDVIEYVPDQHVTNVQGLDCVAPYLKQWCSSYNAIPSLNFGNFVELDTIECYWSHSLTSVTLRNLPKLKRACFEDCDLKSLDLSQCPNLEDLRGALNNYPDINWGSIGSHVWHICIRDNPQMTNQTMFANANNKFPNLRELFIWDDNQTGTLKISATHPVMGVQISASGNHYTIADFSGALQNESEYGGIDLSNNQLTSITLTGCDQVVNLVLNHNQLTSIDITDCKRISNLDLSDNQLTQTAVDTILAKLDSSGIHDGTVDLRNNSAPSATGLTHKANLEGKGWTVR